MIYERRLLIKERMNLGWGYNAGNWMWKDDISVDGDHYDIDADQHKLFACRSLSLA